MEFITSNKQRWPVLALCRVLHVSESGYYKHERSKNKEYKYTYWLECIYKLIKEEPENANYGVRRIWLYLRNNKRCPLSYSTIVRICQENGLIIHYKRSAKGITTPDTEAQKSENLIQQDFTAQSPNQKWLTDITEIACEDGKLYLAAILDCYDGSIRGFKMDDNIRTGLCIGAFERACHDDGAYGMILHSGRGSQFTSQAFRETLAKHGAIQSMSGTGRCYDNARMESFFATLKKEELYQINTLQMRIVDVKSIIYRYIHYYNLRRIYSTNDGWPPLVYRRMYYEAHNAA